MAGKPLSPNAIALARLAAKRSFSELATRVSTSEATIRHIATGRNRPSADVRDRLLEVFKLPLDGWRAPAEQARRPATLTEGAPSAPVPGHGPPHASAGRPEPASLLERYRALATVLEERLAAARADLDTPARDVAAVGQALSRALQHIGKLTGEGEVSERQVLQAPAFRRALEIIRDAAAPFPEASRAIARALEQYVGGIPKDGAA
jgi:transcriptional regulator with XRE-family HTH domain